MRNVRSVDFDAYKRDGYEAQYLYNGEGCRVIASNVPPGTAAPPHHYHPVDQLYYVIAGEMQVQLGSERFVAGPDTLVFIPAGVPHHNWNDGAVDEFHFEVIVPTPAPDQQTLVRTSSTDAGGRPYAVRLLQDDGFSAALPGFLTQKLLQRSDGSEHITLYVGEVAPGAGGPTTHVHDFDQFYYVLEGEMTLEVGLHRHTAGPHTLVILPAGVPHRQWNEGDARERHLTLIVPEPMGNGPWDVGVTLATTGVTHR